MFADPRIRPAAAGNMVSMATIQTGRQMRSVSRDPEPRVRGQANALRCHSLPDALPFKMQIHAKTEKQKIEIMF